MTSPAQKKRAAARAALEHVEPGSIVGVGTGSTADHFIEGLAGIRDRVESLPWRILSFVIGASCNH